MFVRSRFPDREPYRAWANSEFIADDGSINEVDLLLLTPVGFFLVEIKSRPGIIRGDAGTWIWQHDGKLFTDDNPILAADRKAKKLKSLLERQKAIKKFKGRIPFLDPLIFCSAPRPAEPANRNRSVPRLPARSRGHGRPPAPARHHGGHRTPRLSRTRKGGQVPR